ncbi:Exportin-4 [Taenia crassiceps]|uniref:Exportin-4 n=1 Tax=Taenia crassiceps TaxID=6207 RepID=A0ABR4QBJ8_9CEST
MESFYETTVSVSERKQCEEVVLRFRNATHPYELCKHILNTSRNPQMLYEVGRCLSKAVVREWSTVLCPNSGQLSAGSMTESMPYQLLCYLLQWVASCGNEVASFARQSILSSVASIVKRAAAAEAQCSLSKSPSHTRYAVPTLISPSFENSGSPSPLVTFFLRELSSLLTPIPVSSSYQEEFPRLSFGLAILSAFLDEMSDVDQDAASLNLPLEAHVHMQARFQGFELLQIFQFLLRLVESLLCSPDWPIDNVENDETTYRLVHCLEIITSWNFLPEHVVDFTCLRPMARRNSDFRPSERWACVVGVDAISTTLSLFLKLHFRLRSISTYCTRILSSIVALASLNGPLVVNTHSIGITSPSTPCPLAEHASICMSGLARALVSSHHHSLAGVSALLLPFLTGLATSPQIRINGGVCDFVPLYPRVAEIEAAFPPVTSATPDGTTGGFLSYELPLLAELSVNLLRRLVEVCGVVEGFAMGNGWLASDAPGSQGAVLARLVFYLNAVNAFLGLVKTILIECLLLEAGVVGGEKSTADLGDTIRSAHEASERIFAYLSDVSGAVPHFNASNTALSYTTGPSAAIDQMVCVLKQTCGQVRANFQRHQCDLIRVYFASHLAVSVGFRKDTSTTKGANEENEEEIDLEIDEDDQIAYEDSLFAIGQFSSASEGEALAEILEVLAGLLEERVWLLRQQAETQPSFSLLEDLHWLLLFIGHVLVTGPSKIGSSKGTQPAWDSNFSIPFAVWSIGPRSFTVEQFENCQNYLIKAMENIPCDETDGVPSLLRLFGTLFRLLRMQVSSRVGSAQLTEDTLWVFVRLTLTYFSCNHFAGPEGHLDPDDTSILEGEATLFKTLLCPPTNSGGSGGAVARSAHHQLLTHASTALTLSARLAMATWLGEPKVTTLASALLAAIARHSLFSDPTSDQEESNLTALLPAQAWIELCSLVCAVETWTCLETETLAELVDSCTRGCWCLHGVHRASLTSSNLFYQFVEELRDRLTRLIIVDSGRGGDGVGDGDMGGQVTEPSLLSHMVAGLSALRGLTRALRWIVAHGGNSMSGLTSSNPSTAASTGSSDTDLVGFLWTSIILPILQNCSSYFLKCYHMYHEMMVAVVTLFEEVADNCLLYLANYPVILTLEDATGTFCLTNGLQLRFPLPHTGSTQFFLLTVILCAQYAQTHSKRIATKSVSNEVDEERVTELCHLFSLLQFFLAHEFELRLYGVTGTGLDSSPVDGEVGMVTTVDVTLVCVGFLLPLLTQSLLAVPELAGYFYHLLSYALELRPEGLLHLTKDKSAEALSELGRLLRHGIFNLADTTVNISALEALTYLAEFCATRGSQPSTTTTAATTVIVTQLPLGKDLLHELLGLVTRDVFPAQLEDTLAGCIFALATLDPRSFEEVASESVARCSDNATSQQRLQHAFLELSTPLTSTAPMPERKRRNDFQHRFHLFVPTKGSEDYAVANQILLSTQPCDRIYWIPPPTSYSSHHCPVFYSCVAPLHTPTTPFGSLPCLRVNTLPDTPEFTTKITSTRLLLGPNASLVICISLKDAPSNSSLQLGALFPQMSSTATYNPAKQCLFVVIPTPRSFEDIYLQISTGDWLMHLPIPIDLENVQSMDEVDNDELDLEVLSVTHPWKFNSELRGKEAELEDRLSRLFRCTITLGKWIVVTRGLFSGCRVRLSRSAAGSLDFEAMAYHRELHHLLLDYLNRNDLLVTEKKGNEEEVRRESVALNDLRDALLTELGLLKSVLCAPLIRRVLTSCVPLVTASTAISPSMSALKFADLVADWRNAAAGSEPIDKSVAADVLGGSLEVLAAACSTTESIIANLVK